MSTLQHAPVHITLTYTHKGLCAHLNTHAHIHTNAPVYTQTLTCTLKLSHAHLKLVIFLWYDGHGVTAPAVQGDTWLCGKTHR